MHFVAIKSVEQQSVLMVRRARTLVVANRTGQVNQICGLLGEFGLLVPKGVARLRQVSAYDRHIRGLAEASEPTRRLMQVEAIGPHTATS
jgi:transposase